MKKSLKWLPRLSMLGHGSVDQRTLSEAQTLSGFGVDKNV